MQENMCYDIRRGINMIEGKNIKISIILVSYNEKQYLIDALESCIKQNIECNYEIIIGDDGSDDGSIDIIKEYKSRYPELIKYFIMDREHMEINSVIPSIRVSNIIKKGFSIAEGEYAMVLSADDVISENKLRIQSEYLEKNTDKIGCFCPFKMFWDNGESNKCKVINASNKVLWSTKYIHISCFLFRYRNINLLDRFCDDTGMYYSIIKSGSVGCINKVMFKYRQRDNSIMHNMDKLQLDIVEILLFQDILNSKEYKKRDKIKFARPLLRLLKNRKDIGNPLYEKYRINSSLYSNDILNMIYNYDNMEFSKKLHILSLVFFSNLGFFYFKFKEKLHK